MSKNKAIKSDSIDESDYSESSELDSESDIDSESDVISDDDIKEVDEEEDEISQEDENMEDEENNEDDEYYNKKTGKCHLNSFKEETVVVENDSFIYSKLESKRVPDNERQTDPIMTYYELCRIIGTRAQQFNLGAIPLVTGIAGLTPTQMAYIELLMKQNIFIIRRNLPGKLYEDWKTEELEIIHVLTDKFFLPENFDINNIKKN